MEKPRPWGLLRMLSLLLLLAVSVPAVADEVFSVHDVARLQGVGSAMISPDGSQIAYQLTRPRDPLAGDDGPAWQELHVVDRQGNSRPFVTGKVNVNQIRWTPDGQKIAFLAKRNDDKQTSLYLIPANGGEAQRVLQHESDISNYDFHPDGEQVAFLATQPLPKEQQEFRDKGFNQEIYEESLRPTQVWIGRINSDQKARALELPGSAHDVQWNPDGRRLAVVLASAPTVDASYMFRRVRIVDADSGKIVEKIENPGKLGQVRWSPDGKHLAMISAVDIHDPHEGHLMVAAVPGDGSLKDLMPDYKAHVNSLAWLDDKTVLWVADEGTETTVGRITLDGDKTILRGPTTPILSDLSLSRSSKTAAAIGNTVRHPNEAFLLPVEGDSSEPQRLTQHNPWLEERRFAEQKVIQYEAADGLSVQGILIYPLNYQEGQRYPLIVYVHGGPEAHVSNGWLTYYAVPGQVGAARGFATFYPNYRGSTGRGVEFSKMGQADAAGKEFQDLVDGVDHLVAQGLVHKDKVGITGGSYGGYATAWGATYYSERFAAGVMFVGISNNVSKVGTTDIPEEMYLVHHRKRLWEDLDYFVKSSPVRYVQRHQTPLLILHGKEDPRVHPSQSLELYRHLKTLDQAPVRLVLYPGEGHGNRRATSRFDYHLRMMRWMEHYLQGEGGDPPHFAIDYAAHWPSDGKDDEDKDDEDKDDKDDKDDEDDEDDEDEDEKDEKDDENKEDDQGKQTGGPQQD